MVTGGLIPIQIGASKKSCNHSERKNELEAQRGQPRKRGESPSVLRGRASLARARKEREETAANEGHATRPREKGKSCMAGGGGRRVIVCVAVVVVVVACL